MEEENVVNPGGVSNKIPFPSIPNNPGNQVPGELPSARESFMQLAEQNKFKGAQNIPISSFYSGGSRYEKTRPFTNFEEMAAQKQSTFDQYRNGLGKAVGIAGTSFISGTVGLLNGIGSSIANQRFSKLYDNPTTQLMDRIQSGMEDFAPNYYRQAETDAEWWQADNLLTPNFWADKVIKNIGYGIGSIAGGAAWTKAFKLIGKTNALVKLGKGAETAATIEKAMQVVPRAQKISAIEGALGNLSQGVKSQIANNGQRTLTSVMGTFGEASIESLQKSNEFRDNAIAEFRRQNGIDPTGKDLDDINAFAEKAGNYVWGMNTILLSATNFIQLPKILGSSRKVEKAFINDLTQKGLGKKFIEQLPKTRFGKIVDTTKGLGRFFVQPSEAFEEGMQFAIASGVDDYFNRAYTNREDLGTLLETVSGAMGNVFGEGIEKTLNTKEGIESILIGSLAGGIQQAPMSIYREGLTGRGAQRKRNTDIALKQLNETNIEAALKDQANFLAVGIGSQAMRGQAIENNDILSEKDYEADYSLSYLMPRAKYGKMESVYDELSYYKEQAASPQGFAELQTAGVAFEKESSSQFVQRIGNLENTAKAVQKHYDNINETYAGVYKTDAEGKVIEDAKGRPIRKYNPVVIDKLVYAASKIDDYSARIPALTSVLSSAGINISTILNDVLVSEKPTIEAVKESIDQINAMDVVSDVKDNLKRSLSDLIEMSLRRKVFIDDYNDIKKTPEVFEAFSRAERFREKGPVDVTQQEGGKSVVKTLKVGQEYSLAEPIRLENGRITLAPKLTVISETLGGEFEVRLPNGKEVFLSPLEFKTYNISEEDNTSQELENALNQSIDEVLQYPAFRDVIEKPGEKVNKLAYINSLGNKKLSEAIVNRFNRLTKDLFEAKAKQKEINDKIKEQSSDINSQQDEVAQTSTDPKVEEIPFDTRIDTGETGPLKSAARFFNASSNESDDPSYKYYNPNPAPHIIRSRVFLNNAKSNKNRDKFRAITFTYNQEKDLGLSGVTELSYGAKWETQKGNVNDLIDGFVAQVYVEVDGKNRYFIDQNGNRIKGADGKDVKVGQQVDLGKVVFETRPTAVEYSSADGDRFRTREKEEFMKNMETWKQQREILLGNPAKQIAPMAAKDLPTNSFMISKGFPITTEKIDKKYVKNKVGESIVTESQIETQPGLLKISTGTPIVHSGENMNAKPGTVYLQDRDMLQVLNNNLLGAKKAKSVYEVIKSLINDMEKQAAADKPIQLDRQKLKYLGSVMIYARPTKDMLNNQLWIDIESMSVKLGNNTYSFSDFLKNEAEVTKAFSGVYHSANKRLLDKTEPHYEFVFKDDKLDFVKWPNYQSYLLSGTDRSVDEVPFVTNVRKKSEALPYNFRGKYSYLVNFTVGEKNTNFTAPEAQEEKAPVAPPIETKSESNSPSEVAENLPALKVGDFTLNDGSTNIVEVSKQPIEFIGAVNEKGQIKVDLDFRTEANQKSFENVAAVISEETLNTYRSAIPQLNESSSKEDTIVEFFRHQITAKINKALKAQQEAPAPAAPEAAKVTIQMQPANIEKIKAGTKTTTTRSESQAKEINIPVGESAIVNFGGQDFKVTNRGQLTIDEAGGKEAMIQSEGVQSEEEFMYKQTKDWVNGKGKLYVYDIASTEAPVSEELSSKQVELDEYLENVDYRPQSLDLVVSNSGVDKYIVIEAAKNVEEATNKKYGFGSIIHTLKVTGGNLNYPNITKPEKERIRLYNEEIAKLTGKAVEQPTPPAQQPTTEAPPKSNKGKFKSGYSDTRAVSRGELFAERISERDIKAFKKWHAEKVPFIPYEILEQIYKSLDGIVAWGVFEGGVAKFFKRGLRGTEYHEIFEAIWKGFLSESERAALINEFKNKPGYFLDRESGQQIAFSEATDRQVKERIADDFADYRLGKLPARNLSEKVKRFFNAIIEFFKSFVNNPSLKQQLFDEIEAGRFKESILPDYVKTAQPEYRPIMTLPDGAILSEDEAYNIVQDMVISTSGYLLNRGNDNTVSNIFNMKGVTGTEVYNFTRNIYEETGNLQALGDKLFNELFLRSVDNLRPMGVNIDVDSLISVNDEQGNNRLYSPEAFEVDLMKNASFAIKYILATLPSASKNEIDPETGLPALKTGAVGLPVLSNFNRTFATLLSKLSNIPISKIPAKLMELYKNDGNYYRVARSLNGNMSAEDAEELFDFANFTDSDWRLYIQFVQAFNKSRPDATVEERTITPEGVGVIAKPADKSSAINVQKYNWLSNIKVLGRQGGSIIEQNKQNFFIDTEHVKYPKKRPSTNAERLEFLGNIGITFPGAAITNEDQFVDAVNRIYEYGSKNLANFKKFLGADSSITKLAVMYVDSLNPDQDTTRFNVENKRTGNYSDSNAVSVFEEDFNDAQTLDELFKKRPELKDAFSANSLIIKKGGLFFDKDGNKIKGKTLTIGVVDGISEEDGGTTISGLTEGERFSVEINQNVKGNYYILIPADSATERTYNIGNQIKFENTNTEIGDSEFFEIMRSYLDDEINLALDWRNRSKLSAVGKRAKELRFFKEILSPSLVESIEGVIANGKLSKEKALAQISKILTDNKSEVESSIRETIAYQNDKLNKALRSTGEVSQVDENNVDFLYLDSEFAEKNKIDKNKISNDDYNKFLSFLNMNQMIANIELHKFIFGDPYQFEVKNGNLEETKRIKSWLSPRRKTFDSKEANEFLNKKYNKVTDDIVLSGNDITRHNFNSFVKTVTLTDPTPQSRYLNSFGNYKESDGFSLIGIGTFREVKWKNAEWPKEAENWYQWQMAYTRQKLSKIKKANGEFVYKYGKNSALENHDAALIKKPEPYYVLEVLKPIVSGAKPELGRIEGTIDKFSQMPLFFKAIEGTHLQDLYTQMLEEGVGYVVYKSGRKEGTRDTHNVYKGNGTFNSSNFGDNTIENVAWSTYGIQVENSYEEGKQQTRGSQPMKNTSLDMFQYGKAVMEGAQELYDDITETHNEFHQFQYEKFLENLGIEDLGDGYKIKDAKKVSQTLEYELLRREASENVIDTIRLNENGQFGIPFEASSAYEDIRSVLFSIINKSLISPPMEGKPHVQVAATLWENRDKGRRILRKTKDGYVEISRDEYEKLSDKDKEGILLSSDTLKFYEDKPGERHIEVMIPNFWKKYFKGMSDEKILEYLNKSENQKILFGIGFRIPHQAASSTEVFKVKGFLHPSMGSTVVVPSEIVQKAGSDFDIDKLNMYLKAVYVDQNGDVKLVEYKGSKKATMDFYSKVYDEQIKNELEAIESGDEFRNNLIEVLEALESIEDSSSMTTEELKPLLGDKLFKFYNRKQQTINNIINVAISKKQNPSDYIGDQIGRMADKYAKLTEKQLSESMKKDFVDLMYKKSLENRYFELLQEIVTLPENFERLLTPVGDANLPEVAKELDAARQDEEATFKNKLLSKTFLTSLRHAFLLGKKWVGIAAVNITGHSIAQKINAYLDPRRIDDIDPYDASFLGDMSLAVPHNTVEVDGTKMIALGGTTTAYSKKDKKGKDVFEFISDRLSGYATAFVDVAKDPYIMKILRSDLVVSTAMFMERIGVGELTPYFLNQPIIIDYLKYLDRIGSRSLFSKNNISEAAAMYPIEAGNSYNLKQDFVVDEKTGLVNFEKSKANLLASIDITAERNNEFNLKQRAILEEFLRLSKMGQFSFKFTQAYNYDTTRVRTTESVLRKVARTETAEEKNIISSINDVFKQTFIGDQKRLIIEEVKSLSAIFKLDADVFYSVIDEVMRPFVNDEYMSMDDFDRVARKIKTSFIDYLTQNKSTRFSKQIIDDLVIGKNNIAVQLVKLQDKYAVSELLSNLEPRFSNHEGGAVTVSLKVKPKDAASVNRYIGLMRELKAYEPEFYNNLLLVNLLQGTYETKININKIVPLEDRAEIIAPVINSNYSFENIKDFARNGVFFRTNFSDDKVVPFFSPRYNVIDGAIDYGSSGFINMKELGIKLSEGKVIRLSKKYEKFNHSSMDFLKVARYQYAKGYVIDITGERKPTLYDDFKQLALNGEVSKSEIVGYQKVKDLAGTPLQNERGDVYFKMVNLYGDGDIVKIYKTNGLPSPINNNTYKVANELADNNIIALVNNEVINTPETDEKIDVAAELAPVPEVIAQATSAKIDVTSNKADINQLLKDGLDALQKANANGVKFILGFHGGQQFQKPDRSKQYTGEFRDAEAKRIAESMGARYEGQMLFFTEEEGDDLQTYETAVRSALRYAVTYGEANPTVYAYLIPIEEADFTDRGVGEVGLSYDAIEQGKYKEVGRVTMTSSKEATPVLEVVSTSANKFNKKNIFSVVPQQGVADKKASTKASIATQYIGFGEGIRGSQGQRSSTEIYREQAGQYANTGNYSANDVIFVSIPGKRGAESVRKVQQDKTINEAIKALEAGATILTDNKSYIDSSDYNDGEKRLYKTLLEKGYNYSEITEDGQVIGTWTKSLTSTKTQTVKNEYVHEYTYDVNVGTGYDDTIKEPVKIVSIREKAIKNFKSGKYLMDLDLYTVENKQGKQFTFYLKPTGVIVNPKLPAAYARNSFRENVYESEIAPTTQVEEVEFTTTKPFKYFGRFYEIVIDQDGKAIDVVGYKGNKDAKQKLLDAYTANPTVDPQNGKPFSTEEGEMIDDVTPEVVSGNSFKFEDGTVINTGNITLNDQQKEALQLAVNAIKKNQTKFVLRGYAGTGKSTISKFIREYLQNSKSFKDVNYASPTHKANTNLLIQLLRGKVFNTMPSTTASLLNKIKGEDGDFIAGPKDKMPYSGVLIVDESSMIDAQDYNLLIGLAKRKGTTIIFMGDPAQLPPVGSSQLSKALQFSSSEDGVELTQVMRQQGDNPLLDILTNIRQNLATVVDRFSFKTNVNGKGEGVEFTNDYLSFNEKILQYFKSPEYKEDPTYAKVLTYTNASVANYNNLIQSQLGLSPYGVGSILMGYEQLGSGNYINNGQDYKILESEYVTDRDIKVFEGNVGNKYFNIEEKVSGYNVQMRRVFSKEDEQLLNDTGQTALLRPVEVFIINPNDDKNLKFMERVLAFKKVLNDRTIPWRLRQNPLNEFESFFSKYQLPADMISYKGKITTLPKLKQENPELFKVNRQTGKTLFEETVSSEKPMLPKNIDYGYAVTSHKGQGSTYKYVFVDYENMENPANNRVISDADVKYAIERQQLKYVGLSRASKIAFVFSRKAGTDELYSSQEIQSEPSYIPESQESFVPWSTESEGQASGVRSFYESLTPDQKLKLGSLQDIISEYNQLPTEISERTFIEMLMCKL